jgi:hypothetical protein
MNRIQTYKNFLNEKYNFVININTKQKLEKFLKTFESKYIEFKKLENNGYKGHYETFSLNDKETGIVILEIIIKDNIKMSFYKDILPYDYDYVIEHYKTIYNYINYYMTNFYELLKKSDIFNNEIKRDYTKIISVPFINIEKLCDYIVYLNNNDILTYFINMIINHKNNEMGEYKDIKEIFIKKYKHLLDANNFDLI